MFSLAARKYRILPGFRIPIKSVGKAVAESLINIGRVTIRPIGVTP